MTLIHRLVDYLTQIWHEFARTVHLESKKGKTGFWQELSMYLVAIPVGWVLMVLGLLTLFVAVLMVAPIGKLFGYDLGSFFAKTQAKYQDKLRPAQWIPFLAKMHSNRQKWVIQVLSLKTTQELIYVLCQFFRWTSITPAEEVFKNILATIKNLEGKKKSGESIEVVQASFVLFLLN
jgi:hypothetical protein